jgi:hypothetical protein
MVSTEINIIFLVYILAFVGAVVMLFLSVVLMLPASVFTQKSQNLLVLLLINNIFDSAAFINTFFLALPDMLMLPCIIVLIDYLFIQPRQNMSPSYYKWLRREIYIRESQHRNYPPYSLNVLNVISHYVNVLDVLSATRLEKLQNNYRVIKNDAIYYINAAVGPFFTLGYYWNESKNYKYSLFKIFPIVYTFRNAMQPIVSYLKCSAIASLLIFLISVIGFVIINSVLLISRYIYKSQCLKFIDVLMQTITKTSIFLTACPSIYSVNVYYPSLNNIKLISYQDNLVAIKNVLYLEAPLLLIASVTGLLVSLIGTAVMSRPSLVKTGTVEFKNSGLLLLVIDAQFFIANFGLFLDLALITSFIICIVIKVRNKTLFSFLKSSKIIYPATAALIFPITQGIIPIGINRTNIWISRLSPPPIRLNSVDWAVTPLCALKPLQPVSQTSWRMVQYLQRPLKLSKYQPIRGGKSGMIGSPKEYFGGLPTIFDVYVNSFYDLIIPNSEAIGATLLTWIN